MASWLLTGTEKNKQNFRDVLHLTKQKVESQRTLATLCKNALFKAKV